MKHAKLLVLPLAVAGQLGLAAIPTESQAATYILRCESRGQAQTECPVRSRADVSIQRQISMSPCVEGDTWGYDRRAQEIWVSGGCRADFRVVEESGWGGPGWNGGGYGGSFRCESRGNARQYCNIPGRGDVDLLRQLSITPCIEGQTWGRAGRRQIWVDGGCRAEFTTDRWRDRDDDGGWPDRGGGK